MNPSLNRRRFFLKTAGASLALPGLSSLLAKNANSLATVHATRGSGIGARRFVAVGNLLGFQQKSFFPSTEGSKYESTTLLKPLESVRNKMTVYRGLDHGIRGGHFAVHSFLSGVLHSEARDRKNGNVTIDQYLAEKVGNQTRFPSLTVGSEGGIHGGCQLSWTRSGVRVPPITNPRDLFDRLFSNDNPQRRLERKGENALQKSILDAVNDEAKGLSKKVNREDREKLDEYFTSIRDVEKRIDLRRRWADHPKPDAPFEKPANKNTVDDLPILYELIALALQTDSTRIATLEIGGSFLPQNLGIHNSYHSLSHHGNKADAITNLIKLETYQIEQYGKFLGRLQSIQDGEGTLLDATSVLFGSGIGNGNSHTNSDLPIIVAGGGYKHGDFKKVETKGINKVRLCNLFVDLAQRMGVETDSFGNSTGRFS
ncbi:MAG TPA: hypothetical protein DIV46_10105 [Verrucomicrobiales bacterium]|jgi:hypothetical protein|nr:hypothetical protein [Verrucomicrobiales bacterium]